MANRQLASTNPDWWRGAVIYQIYPRSYQDTDGDGIGDLRGVLKRLDHIAALGADAIWLSPFFASPMKDFGYDVSDYRAVDPIFGKLEDFDAVVARAHELGIRVIIDQVLNHSSDQHPWFIESRSSADNPKADWYVWADAKPDGNPPNNWLSVFGGPAWTWDTQRCQYYLHNFLSSQPDLNFHKREVRDALLADMAFWLDRGVDGFRLDTVNYYFHSTGLEDNPPDGTASGDSFISRINPYRFQQHIYDKSRPENLTFLREMRTLLNRYPGVTTVGEIGDRERSLQLMADYTSGGDKLQMCYTFDFLGEQFDSDYIRKRIEIFETVVDTGWACWAFSNHDVPRHATRWYRGERRDAFAKLAAAILLSFRGSVCLYQGEELALTEAELALGDLVDPYGITFWPRYKGRDGCRTPMVWEGRSPAGGFTTGKPWLPVPHEHLAKAVDHQIGDPGSVLSAYRRLIAFRKDNPALNGGSIRFLNAPAGLLAFAREHAAGNVLCLFNLNEEGVSYSLPEGMTATAMDGHGFGGRLDKPGKAIALAGLDAFFGRIGAR